MSLKRLRKDFALIIANFRWNDAKVQGFTLIELLVVIAILAVLAVVVVLTLNPAGLLQESRDANRLSDLSTLVHAISLYQVDVMTASLGSASTTYISVFDPTATTTAGDQCQGLAMVTSSAFSWQCAAPKNYQSANGTGWLPVSFNLLSTGSPLGSLPVDPVNQTSSGHFYTYETNATQYEVTADLESTKYQLLEASDGGAYTDLLE